MQAKLWISLRNGASAGVGSATSVSLIGDVGFSEAANCETRLSDAECRAFGRKADDIKKRS
jgi:hypothetical protein